MVEWTTVNFMRPDALWRFPDGPVALDPFRGEDDFYEGVRVEGIPVSALVMVSEKTPSRGVLLQLADTRSFVSRGKLKPGSKVAGEMVRVDHDVVWIRRKTSLRLNTTLIFMANQLYGSAANGLAHIQQVAHDHCDAQEKAWRDIVMVLQHRGPMLSSQLNVAVPSNTSVSTVVRDTIERAYCEANGMGAEHTERVGTGRYQREGALPPEDVAPLAFAGAFVSLFMNPAGQLDGRLVRPLGGYRSGALFSQWKKPAILEDVREECLIAGADKDADLVERYLDKRFPDWRSPTTLVALSQDDAWIVLNVPEHATFQEAQLSYRRLMKIFHEDKGIVDHRYFAQKLNDAMEWFKRNRK